MPLTDYDLDLQRQRFFRDPWAPRTSFTAQSPACHPPALTRQMSGGLSQVIPSRASSSVVPKLVRAVPQIKAAIRSYEYYPQYFAVIAHNIEQHCCFGSALPPKDRILPPG